MLSPLIWISQSITRNLKKEKNKPVLSRTDFSVKTDLGKQSGALEESEQKIIQNLLRFSRVLVRDIMTPRIVVIASDESMTVEQFHDEHEKLPFSRIPVYKENSDSITGLVLKDDILLKLVEDDDSIPLRDIKRNIIIVHASLPIPDLLDMFINKKEHMALVVDEFGGMEGIVTMEDIIETLLGLEIVDESDNAEDMQALARKNWERRAKRMGILSPDTDEPK